jgi:hypothetical protein
LKKFAQASAFSYIASIYLHNNEGLKQNIEKLQVYLAGMIAGLKTNKVAG